MVRKKGETVLDQGPTSLFLFTPSSPLRRLATWVCMSKAFETVITCTIILNCVTMMLDAKLGSGDRAILSGQLEEFEPVFMVVFTVEMCTRILSMGFILHKNSYMRNMWNIMDFFVVTSGFLPFLMPAGSEKTLNLNTLRTFRVLRPLKLVSGVPSLQVVISSIIKAIGPLANIALLLMFAITIFAIIGLEFFAGALNSTCYRLDNLDEIVSDGDKPMPCNPSTPETAPMGAYLCDANTSICLEKWSGPNAGISTFDNIGLAVLTTFQVVTMEGWTQIMYATNDAEGNSSNWMFFFPLIILGSFFMLNLVLGVLSGEFAKEKDRVESRAAFLLKKTKQRLDLEIDGYMNWICKAEDLILAEDRTTERDRKKITEARRRAAEGKRRKKTEEEELAGAKSNWGLKVRRARIRIRKMCKTQWWFWTVLTMVAMNTVSVMVEHYNQPQWLTDALYYCEFTFLAAFVIEMLTRMFALTPWVYFQSAFNKFDTIVITGSIFELVLVQILEKGSVGFSGLRALRLLRVFKVTKYWMSLRNLVIALMNALASIMSLLFLLFLFIFIFALLGMQLFGGTFNFQDGTPTSNFDSVINALLTVFQVLTEEDWNNVMYTAIDASGGVTGGGAKYAIYFVFLTLAGNYTLLNVFLAIACDSLDQAAELTAKEEAEKERKAQEEAAAIIAVEGAAAAAIGEELPEGAEDKPPDVEMAVDGEEEEEDEFGPAAILPYSALFCLSPENGFRLKIHSITTSPYFENTILFVIFLSSIALALEDPVVENSDINYVLKKFDYVFTSIFGLECILRILDLGLVFHPGSYLRDTWNAMDAIVVTCAVTSIAFQGTAIGQNLKSVKLLRVLRPLKMVNRVPALKAVFDCVVTSLKNVLNILIVYMLFLLIFGMVGVQLFNGKFFFCNDPSRRTLDECQGEFFVAGEMSQSTPTVEKRQWMQKPFNYDNVGVGMITLFAVQTTEGWVAILQDSMAATYEDEGPIPWFQTEVAIFYIVYFVVFPFFFVNIFVALVIVTFNELGEAELTEDIDKNQKSCIQFVINAKPMDVYVPEDDKGLSYHVWRLVTSPPFENFIMILIMLNTLLLMMKYHGAPLYYTDLLSDCNLVFTILFTIECAMKLGCFGPKPYFKDPWNAFDFITVVGSIVDATQIVNVGFLRLFRAARLIKLLRRSVSIRTLLFTFVQSIKALPYVGLLMFMLFFVYAIIGMQLFGNIELDASTALERHNNFRHFFQTIMLLFRTATGEAWPEIMNACLEGRACDPEAITYNVTTGIAFEKTCGHNFAIPYFITFVFLCSFIMLNIVVAVIMDSFDYLTRDSSILGSHHLSEFISVWCEYDPLGEGKIHYTEMFALLKQIDPPLGFGSKCPDLLSYKRLVRMNMPIDDEGRVNFTTTLFALVRVNLQIFMRSMDEMDQADQELRGAISHTWPFTKRDGKLELLVPPPTLTGPNKLTVGKIYGGMLILENWKQTRFAGMPVLKQQMKLYPESTGMEGYADPIPNGHATKIGELPMDTAFGDGLEKNGKAGKPPPEKDLKKKKRQNDLVQNYLDSLDPEQPMDDADQGGPPRLPPKTFPNQFEPIYSNVHGQPDPWGMDPYGAQMPPHHGLPGMPPRMGPYQDEFDMYYGQSRHPTTHMGQQQPGMPLGPTGTGRQLPQPPTQVPLGGVLPAHMNPEQVTVKHILMTEAASRAKSSLGQIGQTRSQEYALPTPGPLERQLSHPNLYQKPPRTAGRQLPKTPQHPPGTIIVIENVLPDQSSLPRPRRGGLRGGTRGDATQTPKSSKTPGGSSGTGFSYHDQLRKSKEAFSVLRGRSSSLPRRGRKTGKRLPALPPIARKSTDKAQSDFPTSAITNGAALPKQPTVPGTGRRLPRTPMQSAIPVHHTPLLPRKRELPTKPMSLDLRHSNRDLLLRAAAGTVGRLSNRSMNFPRVERSPSRCSDNSLILEVEESGAPMRNGRIRSGRRAGGGGSHGFSVGDTPNRPSNGFVSSDLEHLHNLQQAMPLPSIPRSLRTTLYRNRRSLLE